MYISLKTVSRNWVGWVCGTDGGIVLNEIIYVANNFTMHVSVVCSQRVAKMRGISCLEISIKLCRIKPAAMSTLYCSGWQLLSSCYDLLVASNGIVTLRPLSSTLTLLLIFNLLLLFDRLQFFKLFVFTKLFKMDWLLLVSAFTNATVLPTEAAALIGGVPTFVRSAFVGDDGVSKTSEFDRLFRSFGGISEFDRLRMMPVRSKASGSFSLLLSHFCATDGVTELLSVLVYSSEFRSPCSQYVCILPLPFISTRPRSLTSNVRNLSRIVFVLWLMWIFSGSPFDSMREAVFTVSPNKQYRGIFKPTTPATHGPVCRRNSEISTFTFRFRISLTLNISSKWIAYRNECQFLASVAHSVDAEF